jgi:hypothetical protein
MGLNITFHSISRQELQEFFFEVVKNPKCVEERLGRISRDVQKRQNVRAIYNHLEKSKAEVMAGKAQFAGTFAFAAAAIAGYLHPYWYAGDSSISKLCKEEKEFCRFLESLYHLSPHSFPGLQDQAVPLITQNYMGGGYVEHAKLEELQDLLENQSLGGSAMSDYGLEGLLQAIEYAISVRTGILEASDIFVPLSGVCLSDFDNLHA